MNASLGIGHGLQDSLERNRNDRHEESRNPQNDQLQMSLSRLSNISREIIHFSLNSGEYITIYLILWIILTIKEKEVPILQDEQIIITTSDNHKTNQNTEPHQSSTENPGDAHINLFCETRDLYRGQSAANTLVTSTLTSNPGVPQTTLTSGSPKANNDHGPCKTVDHHVPRRIGEQVHLTSRPMTSKYTEYGVQPPQKELYDMDDRNVRAEVRATADAEKAICSAILLGKVDATGSYNVNGHAASIEELQERLGNLRDRN